MRRLMIALVFYYLLLPVLAAWLVLRFIRRYGADPVPEAVRRSCAEDPVEHKWFRVLESAAGTGGARARYAKLGDFDSQDKAVDAAYQGREASPGGEKSWLIVNERGDVLQEIA